MKLFYDMYELDGALIKNGKEIEVPINNSVAPHYPLPSECDKWIKLFENMRDNFTDDEIKALNYSCWYRANEGVYLDCPDFDKGDFYVKGQK